MRATLVMLALASVCAVGLFFGLRDVLVPVLSNETAFAHLRPPETFGDLFALSMRAFVHNWAVALVVPVVGGIAVHYEPRTRLIAAILLPAVMLGSVMGFFLLPLPPGGLQEYILLPLEILGVAAGAVFGAYAVWAGHRGPRLEDTCRLQLKHSALGIVVSMAVLLWAMTYEAGLFLA